MQSKQTNKYRYIQEVPFRGFRGASVILVMVLLLCFAQSTFAQLTQQGTEKLKAYEDTLRALSEKVLNAERDSAKIKACYGMIPRLVEALKTPGSFQYPFESLESVSILYPDDSSFRIFTWSLPRGNGSYRYFGAIQKNSPNKLELIPLYDRSDSLYYPTDTVLKNSTWYGALYYKIEQVKTKAGKKYYMLFGLDGYDLISTRKILDPLWFDTDGSAKFGAQIFELEKGNTSHPKRMILEYKKDASITLNYTDDKKMIVFDHLVAEGEKTADLRFTYMPDGSYDGFQWKEKEGKWVLVDNIYGDVIDSRKNVQGAGVKKGSNDMTQPKGKK